MYAQQSSSKVPTDNFQTWFKKDNLRSISALLSNHKLQSTSLSKNVVYEFLLLSKNCTWINAQNETDSQL